MKSSPLIWQLLRTVKLTVKILSIFVSFSENVNFTYYINNGHILGFYTYRAQSIEFYIV